MRAGDLDGRNIVYGLTAAVRKGGQIAEFSGSIALGRQETVLAFKTEFRPSIRMITPRKDKFKGLFLPTTDGLLKRFYPGDGWGTVYLTDRRILFLRRPDVDELREIYGVSDLEPERIVPLSTAFRATRLIMEGGMEFLEIMHEDITRYERGLRHVKVTFRTVGEELCGIILPREQFDVIEPLLEAKMVQGTRKAIIRADVPVFHLSMALIEAASILVLLFTDHPAYNLIGWAVAVIVPMVVVLREAYVPKISNVKRKKWGEAGRLRTMTIAVGAVSGVIFAFGASVSFLVGSVVGFVFSLAVSSIFATAAIFLRMDWKRAARFEQAFEYEYNCPSCGKTVTRRDIACASCGSCVWWGVKVKVIERRRKRFPWMQRS